MYSQRFELDVDRTRRPLREVVTLRVDLWPLPRRRMLREQQPACTCGVYLGEGGEDLLAPVGKHPQRRIAARFAHREVCCACKARGPPYYVGSS